jgi:mono/diheme cytochrome c family protein
MLSNRYRYNLCCINCVGVILCVTLGCDVPIASFQPNGLFVAKLEKSQGLDLKPVVEDSQSALDVLFGTPDHPNWPDLLKEESPELALLVRPERLVRAAGAVRSDEKDVHFGLFREHCVHCHGVTGDGLGPTSRFLNPYPRDFRLGKFKFKSTPIGKKPTRADLRRILAEGVVGTSMPSFRLLSEEDQEALVDYVIYLSIRGEVERQLIFQAASQYTGVERLYDPTIKESDPEAFKAQWDMIQESASNVANSWVEATSSAKEVNGPPEDYPLFGRDNYLGDEAQEGLKGSIANGRKIFQGAIANCANCHGATGMGDGQKNNYDAWTKDWGEGLDLQDREQIAPMLKLGALKPRVVLPRNLRTGVYRGGSQPIDLYLRIVNGIDGTPMPAAPMQPENPQGLTEKDVWDLVNYLLSLPYEHITSDAANVPPFQRENP